MYRPPRSRADEPRVGDVVELEDRAWPSWGGLRCVVEALPSFSSPWEAGHLHLRALDARPDGRADVFLWEASKLRRVR